MPSRTLSPFKPQLPGQVWLQVALPTGGLDLLCTALPTADKEKRISTYVDPPKYKKREPSGQKSSLQGQLSPRILPPPAHLQAFAPKRNPQWNHEGAGNPSGIGEQRTEN